MKNNKVTYGIYRKSHIFRTHTDVVTVCAFFSALWNFLLCFSHYHTAKSRYYESKYNEVHTEIFGFSRILFDGKFLKFQIDICQIVINTSGIGKTLYLLMTM